MRYSQQILKNGLASTPVISFIMPYNLSAPKRFHINKKCLKERFCFKINLKQTNKKTTKKGQKKTWRAREKKGKVRSVKGTEENK